MALDPFHLCNGHHLGPALIVALHPDDHLVESAAVAIVLPHVSGGASTVIIIMLFIEIVTSKISIILELEVVCDSDRGIAVALDKARNEEGSPCTLATGQIYSSLLHDTVRGQLDDRSTDRVNSGARAA